MSSAFWWALLAAALATLAGRVLPFLLLQGRADSPVLTTLAARLPLAMMVILVVYGLRDLRLVQDGLLQGGEQGWPLLLSAFTVALLHAWRRNALLSILVGTGQYMLLVQGLG